MKAFTYEIKDKRGEDKALKAYGHQHAFCTSYGASEPSWSFGFLYYSVFYYHRVLVS